MEKMKKIKKIMGISIAVGALFGIGQTVQAETPQFDTIEAFAQNVQDTVIEEAKTGDLAKTIAHLKAITEKNDRLFAGQAQLASFKKDLSDQLDPQKATGTDLRKIVIGLNKLTGSEFNYQQIYQDILGLNELNLDSYHSLGIDHNNCLQYFTVAKQIFNEDLIKVQNDLADYKNGKTMALNPEFKDSLTKAFFVCSTIYQNVPDLFTTDYQDSMIDLYLNFLKFGSQFNDSKDCAVAFLNQIDLAKYSAQINDKLANIDFSTGTSLNYVQHLLNNRFYLFNLRNTTIEESKDVETNNMNFTLVQLHQLRIDYKNQGEVLQHTGDLAWQMKNQATDLSTCQKDLAQLQQSQEFLQHDQSPNGTLIFSETDLVREIAKLTTRIKELQTPVVEAIPEVEQRLAVEKIRWFEDHLIDLEVTKQNYHSYLVACKQLFDDDLKSYQFKLDLGEEDDDQLRVLKVKMKNLFLFGQKIYQQFSSGSKSDHNLMFDLVAKVEDFNYNDEDNGHDEVFGDLEEEATTFLSSIDLREFSQGVFTQLTSPDLQRSSEDFKQLLLREKILFYATSLNNSDQLTAEFGKLPDDSNRDEQTIEDLVIYLAECNRNYLKFQELEFNFRADPVDDLWSLAEYRDNYRNLLIKLKKNKEISERDYYNQGMNLDDYLIIPKGELDEQIATVEKKLHLLQDKMQQEWIKKQLKDLEFNFRTSPAHDLKSLTKYRDNYRNLLAELKKNKENLARDYSNQFVNLDNYLIVPSEELNQQIAIIENRLRELTKTPQELVQKQLTTILTELTKIKYADLPKYNYKDLVLNLLDMVTTNSSGRQIIRDNYLYQGIINMRKNHGLTSKQQNILDYLLVHLYLNTDSNNDNYDEEINQAYQRLNAVIPEPITKGLKELTEHLKEKQKTKEMDTKANGEVFYQDATGNAKKLRDVRPTPKIATLQTVGHNYSRNEVEKFKQRIKERIIVSNQHQDSVQSKRVSTADDLKHRYDLKRIAICSANDANHPERGNLSDPKPTDKIVEVVDDFHTPPLDNSRYSLFSDQLPDGRIGINPLTIKQGNVGDCYLLVVLFNMAINDIDYLRSMIHDTGDFVYVRFYHHGQPIYYKVSKNLSANKGAIESSFWVRILEKAYAAYRNNFDQQNRFTFSEDSYDGKFDGGYPTDVVDDFYPDGYKGSIIYTIKNSIINHDSESIVTFNRMKGNYSKDDLQVFFGMQQVLSKTGGMVSATQSLVGAKYRYRDQITHNHEFSVIQCLANQKTADGHLVNLVTIRNPWGDEVGHGVPKYSQTSSGRWILVPDSKTNHDLITLELKDFTRLLSEIEMSFDKNEAHDKLQIDDVLKTISTLQKSSEAVDHKKEILTASEQYQKLIADLNQFKLLDLNDDRIKAYQILPEFLVNLLAHNPPAGGSDQKYDICLQIITRLIKNGFYQVATDFITIYNSHYASGDYNKIITEFTTKLFNKIATVNREIFKWSLITRESFSESDQQQLNQNDEVLDKLWNQVLDCMNHDFRKVAIDLKCASLYNSSVIDSDGTDFCQQLIDMINSLKEFRGKLINPGQPISIDYDADSKEDDDLATEGLNLAYQDLEQVAKYNEEISHLRAVKTLIDSYEEFSSGAVPASNRADFINEQKAKWLALKNWATHFYSDYDYLCLLAQLQLDYYEHQ